MQLVRQMKSPYLLSVRRISGIGEIGFQIVGVSSQAQAGAIVINLPEVGIERPVLLHHENDVVHALERARGSRRCWGAGVGVGPVLAPSPWQPVSMVRDNTAKTAANVIFFSWVIRPCMDKLSATAGAQSDIKKQQLRPQREMSSLRSKVGCCWIYLVLTSQAGVLTSKVFSCSRPKFWLRTNFV